MRPLAHKGLSHWKRDLAFGKKRKLPLETEATERTGKIKKLNPGRCGRV
jgi:hypothetical protein